MEISTETIEIIREMERLSHEVLKTRWQEIGDTWDVSALLTSNSDPEEEYEGYLSTFEPAEIEARKFCDELIEYGFAKDDAFEKTYMFFYPKINNWPFFSLRDFKEYIQQLIDRDNSESDQ